MYTYAKVRIRQSFSQVNQLVLSKTFLSLFWGYGGVVLLNILAYPILTRFYEPQAFGELALYSNTVVILSGLGALSLEKAIVLAKSKLRALNLIFLAVGVLAVSSTVSGLIFLFLNEPLYKLLEISGNLRYYWLLLPFVVFVAGVYQIASAGLLRKAAFQELSLNRFLLRASSLIIQMGLVLLLGARYGLIIGFIAGFALVSLVLFYRYFHLGQSFRFNLAYSKQSWQRFSDIPCYSFPQSLFSHISSKIPFIMLAVLFSIEEVGYFSVAYGLLSLPEAFIAIAIGDLFFQKISTADSLQMVKKMLRHYWISLLLLGVIPFGVLAFHGENIVVLLMGETWRTTAKLISVMAPMFLLSFITTPTSSTLTVIRRQKWDLVFGITSFVARPLIFYAGFIGSDVVFAITLWGVYEIFQLIVYNLMVYRLVSQNSRRKNQKL